MAKTLERLDKHNMTRKSSIYDHRQRGTLTALWDLGEPGKQGFSWVRDVLANMNLAGTYTQLINRGAM